ncbi:MAG: SPOR domain-containing protein [Hahellaceae bacterium]|jgi:hypothetical protein|nr:SPOR domain-containing protein [Hahellaceae bacterium]
MHWVVLFLFFLNGLVMATQWVEARKNNARFFPISTEQNVRELELLREVAGWQSGDGICRLLGPLELKSDATELVNAMSASGVSGSIHESTVQLAPEYWVYLPPYESKELALKTLKKLQSKGVDSYLISQGVLRNGISLGFFRNSDTAKILLDRRLKQGYMAKLKEVPRSRKDFWVKVARDDLHALQQGQVASVMKKIPAREIFCK